MNTSAADLAYWMGWESKSTPQNVQKQLFISLTKEQELIFILLENKKSLDDLGFQAKLSISKGAVLLFQLKMEGYVRSLSGKQYERIQYPILERTRNKTSNATFWAF